MSRSYNRHSPLPNPHDLPLTYPTAISYPGIEFRDMATETEIAGPIQSVGRALLLLDWLAEGQAAGEVCALQDAADRLGVPASTAHNLLKTLSAAGYVARGARGYELGVKCAALARASRLTADAAAETLDRLAASTGESCVLATLLAGRRRVIGRVEGHSLVRVGAAVADGDRDRFWDLETGRVLAAFADEAELAAIVELHGLPGEAWDGIDSPEALDAALADLRSAGFAEEAAGKREIVALAAPVIDPHGQLLGALGLYLPAYRADEAHLSSLKSALALAAKDLGGRV